VGADAAAEEVRQGERDSGEKMGVTLVDCLQGRPASSARVATIPGRRSPPDAPWPARSLHGRRAPPDPPCSVHRSAQGASMADGSSSTAEPGRLGGGRRRQAHAVTEGAGEGRCGEGRAPTGGVRNANG
jgi:hypothetical protein